MNEQNANSKITAVKSKPHIVETMLGCDLTPHKVLHPRLWVLADMLAITKRWPEEIVYHDKTYHFQHQEELPELAIGHYSGYALYEMQMKG